MTPVPRPPSTLSVDGKKLWKSIVAVYALEASDLDLLASALRLRDVADQAARQLAKDGLLSVDRYGSRRSHPLTDVELRARAGYARLLAQIGIRSVPEESRSPRSAMARHAALARWGRTP